MTTATIDRPATGQSAGRRLAHEVTRQLAKREPVVVDVEGYGAGWYVLAVDWGRELFTVRRSGGGDPIDVAWGSVR
jgi:hypothetical protein